MPDGTALLDAEVQKDIATVLQDKTTEEKQGEPLDPSSVQLLDRIDTLKQQEQATPDEILQEIATAPEDRVDVYAHEDRIAWNAGHTDSIKKAFPGLLEVATLHQVKVSETSTQEMLSIPTDVLTKYLIEHQEEQPQGVLEVFDLIGEELKQRINPNRTIKGIQEDREYLAQLQEEGADPEEITEIEESIAEAKKSLSDDLTMRPLQVIAIRDLLQSDDFTQLFDTFSKSHGHEQRMNTSETNLEFFSKKSISN